LEGHPNFKFLPYPNTPPFEWQDCILLDIEGPPLRKEEGTKTLCLIDSLWRYTPKIKKALPKLQTRSIPQSFQTAYPRRQEDCIDPLRGLASIEALYIAHFLLGWDTAHLLEHYYFKAAFLEKNKHLFI
jgi:pre-rRNA-processing protein TSR3